MPNRLGEAPICGDPTRAKGQLSLPAMSDQKIKNLERRVRKLEQQLEFVADRAGVGADLVELKEAEEAAANERTEETLAKLDALYGRRR